MDALSYPESLLFLKLLVNLQNDKYYLANYN